MCNAWILSLLSKDNKLHRRDISQQPGCKEGNEMVGNGIALPCSLDTLQKKREQIQSRQPEKL